MPSGTSCSRHRALIPGRGDPQRRPEDLLLVVADGVGEGHPTHPGDGRVERTQRDTDRHSPSVRPSALPYFISAASAGPAAAGTEKTFSRTAPPRPMLRPPTRPPIARPPAPTAAAFAAPPTAPARTRTTSRPARSPPARSTAARGITRAGTSRRSGTLHRGRENSEQQRRADLHDEQRDEGREVDLAEPRKRATDRALERIRDGNHKGVEPEWKPRGRDPRFDRPREDRQRKRPREDVDEGFDEDEQKACTAHLLQGLPEDRDEDGAGRLYGKDREKGREIDAPEERKHTTDRAEDRLRHIQHELTEAERQAQGWHPRNDHAHEDRECQRAGDRVDEREDEQHEHQGRSRR